MESFDNFCNYLSKITTIQEKYIETFLAIIIALIIFGFIKKIGFSIIKRRKSVDGSAFFLNQNFQIFVNIIEIFIFFLIFSDYIKSFMTLISVLSAAITIALREIILNFFLGIYIRVKKPFKVEDRIEIDGVKGDVMNISSLDFEIMELSNKEENGQSTGIVVRFPNSILVSKPVKNISKGFKYIWNELVVRIELNSDLSANKKELYKIINNIDVIKNIPAKMKNQIKDIQTTDRVYFNKYEPIIYTKINKTHIELTLRYLMHPKKSRYIESIIWEKIYQKYREGKINLYTLDA